MRSIPGWGTKIPQTAWPKKQKQKNTPPGKSFTDHLP